MSSVIFIDANQYLELYRMVPGKRLLESLEKQQTYIFISRQIVNEVFRNKFDVARWFFSEKLAEVVRTSVPDHLFGLDDEKTTGIRKILADARQASRELKALAAEALSAISRSDDVVSKRLGKLFERAVDPTDDELGRARARKELGNPPGKRSDPLGDQVTWEQLLGYCKQHKCTRVWIVTADTDFRGAVRGLLTFDSRPWLGEIVAATLVVGGTHDDAVPRHHFDTLVGGIPGATGRLVDRAGHTLVWTHTREFADIIGAFRP